MYGWTYGRIEQKQIIPELSLNIPFQVLKQRNVD